MLQAVWQSLLKSTHNTKDMAIPTDIGEIIAWLEGLNGVVAFTVIG